MVLVVASSTKELQGAQRFPLHEGLVRMLPSGTPLVAVSVGVGKIQAAIGTFEAIHTYHPTKVFGIGSCCAVGDGVNLGDLLVPSRLVQYDIDLRRFGLPRGTVFGANGRKVGLLTTEPLSAKGDKQIDVSAGSPVLYNATIGSADRFLSSQDRGSHRYLVDELHVDAVDMESYAMVCAAQRMQVPITIIRAVSDNWNGERVRSLPRFLKESSQSIFDLIACCR